MRKIMNRKVMGIIALALVCVFAGTMIGNSIPAATADERNAHWRKCQEIVREDCPWIFVHVRRNLSLVRDRVKNYVPGAFPYGHERYLGTEAK